LFFIFFSPKSKGKVILVLIHYSIKHIWAVEVQLQTFLTLALDRGEWSA